MAAKLTEIIKHKPSKGSC